MQKRYIFYIIIFWLLFAWIVLWYRSYSHTLIEKDKLWCSISTGDVACKDEEAKSTEETNKKIVKWEFTIRNQLYGKPTFLRRAGKFCAYCRDKLPEVEQMILNPYKDQINIQLMTMDFENKPFDTLIPQSSFEIFNFEDFTWEPCDTFPTWVVLDRQWDLVSSECGGKTTIQQVSDVLAGLL